MQDRIAALDVGDKTVGVAVSDPLGWTAQPVTTIRRKNLATDCGALIEIFKQYEVKLVIVGMPYDMRGEVGHQGKKVEAFVKRLKKELSRAQFAVEMEYRDESMTTHDAEGYLLEADVSRAKRKKVIDKVAAVMILGSYLREKKEGGAK